jgi:hypothetical protein
LIGPGFLEAVRWRCDGEIEVEVQPVDIKAPTGKCPKSMPKPVDMKNLIKE